MNRDTDLLLRTVEDTAERLRFPALLTALAQGQEPALDLRTVAVLAVHDLARPLPAADTIRALLRNGEFALVTRLLDASEVTEAIGYETIRALREALALARDQAVDDLRGRLDALRSRAARVGADVAADGEIDEAVKRSTAEAAGILATWEREVDEAETAAAGQLERRLAGFGRDVDDEWAESVRACIHAEEFEVAAFLLDQGPGEPPLSSPVLVPRLPAWPLGAPFSDIMAALEHGEVPPGLRGRWQQVERDPVATRLVEALVRIATASEPIGASHVEHLVVALDSLLGMDEDLPHRVAPRMGGFLSKLYGVNDPRVPEAMSLGREGLALYVPQNPAKGLATATDAIGPAVTGPVLWLSTADSETSGPRTVIPGWAMLHGQTILRLLLSPSHRRVNLLRVVCAQLRVRDLLPHGFGAQGAPDSSDPRTLLSWLLDLLDVEASSVLLDTILHDTGARPAVVELLLHALVPDDRPHPLRLGRDDLRAARERPEFRAAAREVLLAPVARNPLARAVLFAARYFEGKGTGETLGAEGLAGVLGEWRDVPPEALGALGGKQIEEALRRLAASGLVSPAPEPLAGRYQMPRSGLLSLLEDIDPEAEVAQALGRLGRLARTTRTSTSAKAPTAADRATRLIVHNLTHAARGLGSTQRRAMEALDRGTHTASVEQAKAALRRGRAQLQRLDDAVEKERQWRENPHAQELVNLADLRNGILNPLEDEYDDIFVVWGADDPPESPPPAKVWGHPVLLEAVLRSLVNNAIEAMQQAYGGGSLRMSASLERDLQRGPVVQVDVEDSGPGVEPERADDIWRDGFSTKPSGQGTGNGLPDARNAVQDYGGTIELLPDRSELGGAHFRIRLPAATTADADGE